MKVYAHYLGNKINNKWDCSIDGFQYRWRTLLQFGDSWEIIGSVYMKNPGSAKPTDIILTDEEKLNLKRFDEKNSQWYVFTSDNTMHLIEKLFIAKNKGESLNGVIQIFNLFNIRDADLTRALDSDEKSLESINNTTDEDIEAIRVSKAPVYLGWGGLGCNPKFIQAAKKIFGFVYEELEQKYLWPEFADNSFYHPQYLMGRGKNRPRAQWLLQAFCENRTDIKKHHVNISQSFNHTKNVITKDNSRTFCSTREERKAMMHEMFDFICTSHSELQHSPKGVGYRHDHIGFSDAHSKFELYFTDVKSNGIQIFTQEKAIVELLIKRYSFGVDIKNKWKYTIDFSKTTPSPKGFIDKIIKEIFALLQL